DIFYLTCPMADLVPSCNAMAGVGFGLSDSTIVFVSSSPLAMIIKDDNNDESVTAKRL
ncbi:hypothetical protein S83_042271, partial [Arachis hypogaea]